MTAERNFWPGQSTQAQRKRARKDIILEDVGITSATLQRYYTAVSRLAPCLKLVNSEIELDEAIAEWVQQEFEDGTPLHLVGDALCGLDHFEPSTRRKLHKSWRLYSIWRKYEVPCRAPPVTQDIALALAGWCLAQDELVMAGLILLGFHCLLRTGELLTVRPCDFLLETDRGLVTLPSSKSGIRHNSRESVAISDPITLEVARAMVHLQTQLGFRQVPCWNKSGSSFRDLFRRAVAGSFRARLQTLLLETGWCHVWDAKPWTYGKDPHTREVEEFKHCKNLHLWWIGVAAFLDYEFES